MWAFISTLAAVVAVTIAYLQWKTAQTKVALDIHATRYAIYQDLRDAVTDFLRECTGTRARGSGVGSMFTQPRCFVDAIGCSMAVSDGVLVRLVAQIALDGARIDAVVRQFVAAAVPQHRDESLLGDELRALRSLKRDAKSLFIFVSERGAPFTVSGFAKLVERAGIEAKLPFKVHPHMLRHATGYALANRGVDTRSLQAYLGHRSIQSTVRYTELAPGRFKNIWR